MEAKAKFVSLTYDRAGNKLITFSVKADCEEEIDQIKDCDLTLKVTKEKKRRSLDANAYCWVLLNKLGVVMKRPPEELYKRYIQQIPGANYIVCVKDSAVKSLTESWENKGIGRQAIPFPSRLEGCTNVRLYYGSSEYDNFEMQMLINLIVEDCKDFGIETLTPYELDKIKNEWRI